jgi:hypothetical protein
MSPFLSMAVIAGADRHEKHLFAWLKPDLTAQKTEDIR